MIDFTAHAQDANEEDLLPLLNKWQDLKELADLLARQLKAVQKDITRIETEDLPEKMKDVGIVSGNLPGFSVSLKKGTNVSIKKDHKEEALDWLENNGLDWLIKTEVRVPFGKGEAPNDLEEVLREHGYAYTKDRGVHAQTMKAEGNRLANRRDDPVQFPEELFGVYDYNKATVKPIQDTDNEDF